MPKTALLHRLLQFITRSGYRCGLLSLGLLAACSPFTVLNGFGSDASYRCVQTVAYGALPRQKLDIYRPDKSASGIVVVFFYGGSWRMGARDEYRFVAQTLTRYGATVVVPDYRLYPEATFPAFMDDAAAAVAWTHRHIAAYGGDPKKVYLLGHSAGAHIVTLLALDRRYLAAQGLDSSILSGVDALSAPTDFAATLGPQYRPVFVDQARLERAQPIHYARADAPPMLLQHGADDTLVLPRNSTALAAAIAARGGTARALIYPGMGHPGTVLAFSELLGSSPVLRDTLHFLGLDRTATTASPAQRLAQIANEAAPVAPVNAPFD
jgi:acetyl esterase/lipase